MKYKILNKTYALFSNYRNNWWANQNLKNVTMETEIISKTCFFYVFFNYHRSYYQIKKVIPVFEINMLDKKNVTCCYGNKVKIRKMNDINKAKILVSNTMKKIFDICGKHAKLLHQIFFRH